MNSDNNGATMTPTQKIKWLALNVMARWRKTAPPPYPCADVDERYDAEKESGDWHDATEEVRCSGEDTDLGAGWNRNYESKSIAARLPDGTWVGWTYFHGGGKHSDPSAIPWMENAYDVTMREETRVVRVFARDGAESGL